MAKSTAISANKSIIRRLQAPQSKVRMQDLQKIRG